MNGPIKRKRALFEVITTFDLTDGRQRQAGRPARRQAAIEPGILMAQENESRMRHSEGQTELSLAPEPLTADLNTVAKLTRLAHPDQSI